MAAIFLYLAVDEASRIHEMTIVPLNRALHARGVLLFTWVVPAAGLLVVFVLAYRRFVLDLDRSTRWRFIGAGALYVAGALGMELIEGVYASSHGFNNPRYTAWCW